MKQVLNQKLREIRASIEEKLEGLSSHPLLNKAFRLLPPALVERFLPEKNKDRKHTELLAERSVFIDGPVSEETVGAAREEILEMIREDPQAPVYLCINTQGGDERIAQGFQNFLKVFLRFNRLVTVAMGHCDPVATILLMSGSERIAVSDCVIEFEKEESLVGFHSRRAEEAAGDKAARQSIAITASASALTGEQAFKRGLTTGLLE